MRFVWFGAKLACDSGRRTCFHFLWGELASKYFHGSWRCPGQLPHLPSPIATRCGITGLVVLGIEGKHATQKRRQISLQPCDHQLSVIFPLSRTYDHRIEIRHSDMAYSRLSTCALPCALCSVLLLITQPYCCAQRWPYMKASMVAPFPHHWWWERVHVPIFYAVLFPSRQSPSKQSDVTSPPC